MEQIRIDQSPAKSNELKYLAFVIIPVLFIIGMGSHFGIFFILRAIYSIDNAETKAIPSKFSLFDYKKIN